jgi:hypothetical protein
MSSKLSALGVQTAKQGLLDFMYQKALQITQHLRLMPRLLGQKKAF